MENGEKEENGSSNYNHTDNVEEVELKTADELPPVVDFNAIIGEDEDGNPKINLDLEELEKLQVGIGQLVKISVSRIPEPNDENDS